ncbi:F0F1 ATP synthase subunit A [Candidatus Saccharibacteria bacterium]|nr:F0F1 ATP synthase subunit A [Candidatus Saccharibacteria bacterium]
MIHSLLSFVAAGDGPSIHITPGELFQWNGHTITNSILYGWLSSIVILIALVIVARMMTLRPRRGLIQFVEIGTEFIISTIAGSLGSRAKAVKYAPYFVSAFFFVMFTNWLGLLPGVGEAITYNETPVFRPFTADLNGTIAAATVMMVLVQVFAIKESGALNHLKHYFSGSLKNPMTWFLGVFEIFSEFTRIASLGLRLFLNVAIGEVIIAIFTYLGSFVAPLTALPFLFLELFVGALQAYIFVMLCIMYLGAAIHHEHEEAEVPAKAVPAEA